MQTIRRAQEKDIPAIMDLLSQVLMVHHHGRPDLFKPNATKYTVDELKEILQDEARPIFGFADENDHLLGYAFCVLEQHKDHNILTDIKTLYIDDICVDERSRGMHVGKALYEYVKSYARSIGCYNVTLNVWSCNPTALKFYESLGLVPYKIGMETIL
ncbi:MAG: GNAT family N-acetyltransferase [Clostridiales bacterium]|nr:GNAT family N-acetyltransferase [Clostridiales bacterium]